MNEVCLEVVNKDGVAWQANRPLFDENSYDVKDSLGIRDGILSSNVFKVVQSTSLSPSGALQAYVEIPHHNKLDAISLFSIAIFVNMPTSSNNGLINPLVCKIGANGYILYQKDGNLYFEISEALSSVERVSTVASGINFCDGKSHLIFVIRDTRYDQAVLSLEVYEEYEVEKDITAHNASNTSSLFLGCANPDGLSDPSLYAAEGIHLYGFTFIRGKALDRQDKYLYFKRGQVWANDMVQLQLDEVSGEVCFDSAGLDNHGIIRNYVSTSRVSLEDAFSWSNQYGYNTGAYVISQGYSSIIIGGETFSIDSSSLIPFQTGREEKDVFNLDLQEKGRGRKNARITKILCFKSNGTTRAVLPNPEEIIFNPLAESVGFCCGFVVTALSSGVLFDAYTDVSLPSLKISISTGTLTIVLGDLILTVPSVLVGEHMLIINSELGVVTVYLDGTLVSSGNIISYIAIGTPVINLFSDGVSHLNGTSIAFLGFAKNTFLPSHRIAINNGEFDSLHGYVYLTVPMSKVNTLIDASGYARHTAFLSYVQDCWNGRQSLTLHFMKGFTKIFPSSSDLNSWAFIPYTVQGTKIPFIVYSNSQVELACVPMDGIPKHDFFLDFNPEVKELGFYSRFWNKNSIDIWTGLSAQYDSGNNYEFHIDELSKSYLNTALDSDWYNFAFLTEINGVYDICKEITDILLINLGSDFIPKSFDN